MKEVINAFHPLYARTYHPDLLASLRLESRQKKAGETLSKHVEKQRETHPSHGTIQGVSKKVVPDYMAKPKKMMKRPILSKEQQSMTMKEVTDELIANLKLKGKK